MFKSMIVVNVRELERELNIHMPTIFDDCPEYQRLYLDDETWRILRNCDLPRNKTILAAVEYLRSMTDEQEVILEYD